METVLAQIPIKQHCDDQSVIHTEVSTTPFRVGLNTLIGAKTLSIPVVNPETSKWTSFGVLDVLQHLYMAFGEEMNSSSEDVGALFLHPEEHPHKVAAKVEEKWKNMVENKSIGDILSLYEANSELASFDTIPASATWADAAKALVKARRVGVLNASDPHKLDGIVTHSDLLAMCLGHLTPELEKKLSGTVLKDTPFLDSLPISVAESSALVMGFLVMAGTNVSGAAVVNDKNILADSLSAHDLVTLFSSKTNFVSQLFGTVEDFCQKLATQELVKRPESCVTAYQTDSVASVLQKLTEFHVHRVFVVKSDESGWLEGVVGASALVPWLVKL